MTDSVSGGSPYAPQNPGSPPPSGSPSAADAPAPSPAASPAPLPAPAVGPGGALPVYPAGYGPGGYGPGGYGSPRPAAPGGYGSQRPGGAPAQAPPAGPPGYPQPGAGYPQANPGYPQPGTGYPQPGPAYPQSYPQGSRPPADSLLSRPVALQAVPGTPFAVAVVGVAPTSSGPATGSLAAGVGSILVSLVVACFGLTGAGAGWGPVVSGAFAILAGVAGLAGVGLGLASLSQVKRSAGMVSGRGLAIAGIICGGVGLLLTVFAFVAGFALLISD